MAIDLFLISSYLIFINKFHYKEHDKARIILKLIEKFSSKLKAYQTNIGNNNK